MNRKKPLAVAAIRKLGLGVDELLRRSFTGSGMIPFDYYQMFWFQLGSAGGTTEFMPLVLARVITELERKAAGPVKGKEKAQDENKDAAEAALSPVLLQGLVNTIMFTTLYLKCNPKDNRILKHLERWAELDKSKKISGYLPSAAEAIRVLGVMKDEAAALNTIVISCSTLRTGKEFQELEKCACLDDSSVPDADSCFFFSYLRAAIVDDASRMEILKATYAKMLTLPAQMKTQPTVAETTLLALLFMLKQFIASGPVTDTQFLRKAMSSLRQFYLWPKPFGTFTRDILQTLKDELICPGSLLRNQFDAEAKVAHYKPVRKNGEYGRAVYYLWEADHPESKTRAAIMELRSRKPAEKKRRGSRVGNIDMSSATRLSGTTQALLMLNLMAEEKEVGASDVEVELFSKLTEAQIGTLYSKFQDMVNSLRTLTIDKAGPMRVAELKKIKTELANLAAKGTAGTTPIPKEKHSPFLPELPTLVHTSVETVPGGYHQESKDQLGLMCLEYIPYPTTPFEEQLETIFANYATVPKPITVRLVIAGGNKLFHSFLCSFMRMEQLHMEWIKGITIQLFVAPWSSNDLANFIARHDSWYNRHVHVPSRTPLLVLPFSNPTDELFEPDDTEDAPPVEKPGQFLRETMTSYIRGAQQTLPVNVYLLEGWLDPVPVKSDKDKTEKKQKDKKIDLMADSIVPFVGRVLLGEEADKQQAEKKSKNAKFTYNPEDLIVRFSRMDLAGNTFATQAEDPLPYQTITIANLPVTDDVCYASDPSVPWLEMHALASKKADATKVGGRNLLLTDPRQHVDSVEVSCSGPSQSFSCLVDGVLFGPFHHIKVSRCRKSKSPETGGDKGGEQELGDPYILPISTFFPVNV
jgi:hypothetical protein